MRVAAAWSSPWWAATEARARALRGGRDPAVTGEEGIKSLELIAAIYLSSCRGRPVRLPVDRSEYDELLEELTARRQLIRP